MIGKQIAAMRREKRIKQDELAAAVNVTPQAVSKWEHGGVPDIELLPAIADFFGVSIDYLFGRSSTDNSANPTKAIMTEISSLEAHEKHTRLFFHC